MRGAQQTRSGDSHRDRHQQRGDHRARQRADVRREKKGHHRRAGETSDAKKRVKAGHERRSRGALDLDRMDIHRDVEGAERRAEGEKRDPEQQRRVGDDEQRQHERDSEAAREDDRPAAVSGVQNAGQKHQGDGADAKAEQEQPQRAVVDMEFFLGEGDKRRPAGDAKTRHQKRKPRREPRLRPVGRR